jgi:GNAT superfamily N-acetyltransferase
VSGVHVAQINLGTLIAPPDDPQVAPFMDALDRINAIADGAPGFVWRLQTDAGNATDIHMSDDPRRIVNMSVWESVETLKAYAYRSEHVDFFRRRGEWFEPDAKQVALWHIADGEIPELDDALRRVAFLDTYGASAYAFRFGRVPKALTFEVTDLDGDGTRELVTRLNAELAAVAVEPGENHFDLTNDEVTGANGRMVGARHDGRLVGCGALRRIEGTVGELKRMFVDPTVRGHKFGAAILDQLELWATRLGIDEIKLETGPRQTEANGLYRRAGFERCDAWGEYLLTPTTSRCYRKLLA